MILGIEITYIEIIKVIGMSIMYMLLYMGWYYLVGGKNKEVDEVYKRVMEKRKDRIKNKIKKKDDNEEEDDDSGEE